MKMRHRARRLKHQPRPPKLRGRDERMDALLRKLTSSQRLNPSSIEEALLSAITTSGRFTLQAALDMYAGVKRRRGTADNSRPPKVDINMRPADLDELMGALDRGEFDEQLRDEAPGVQPAPTQKFEDLQQFDVAAWKRRKGLGQD